jgi:hypothetical protein
MEAVLLKRFSWRHIAILRPRLCGAFSRNDPGGDAQCEAENFANRRRAQIVWFTILAWWILFAVCSSDLLFSEIRLPKAADEQIFQSLLAILGLHSSQKLRYFRRI